MTMKQSDTSHLNSPDDLVDSEKHRTSVYSYDRFDPYSGSFEVRVPDIAY